MRIALVLTCFLSLLSAAELTILRSGDWVPYHYHDKEQKLTGTLIDLVTSAAAEAEIEMEIETVLSWNRCLTMMREGESKAFFPLFKTAERAGFMHFLPENILAYERDVCISLKKNIIDFTGDVTELEKYTVGTVQGYSYGSAFDSAAIKKVATVNEAKLLELLLHGDRYDVIVGDEKVFRHLARERGVLDQLQFSDSALVYEPLYIGFSKKGSSLEEAKRFGAALTIVKKKKGSNTVALLPLEFIFKLL